VIGGGDWTPDGLVADLARARARGETPSLRSPEAIRPWQHVLEPLAGYLTLAAALSGPSGDAVAPAYNFGPVPEDDATVGEVTDGLVAAWDTSGDRAARWHRESAPQHLPEAGVLRLDIDKARRELGWEPRWRLGEAISRTARWYRAFEGDPESARAECLTDIRAYGPPVG
jgi:CDP-glucose 4,6-dehydratase